jgi:hypothetical protein
VNRLLSLPEEIAAAEARYYTAQQAREGAEHGAVLAGDVNGRNETERKAQLWERTAAAEAELAAARTDLHLLQNELSALRAAVRLLAGGQP